MKPIFSILICSLLKRSEKLKELLTFLGQQATNQVEILVEIDKGQKTIGGKRNLLLKRAKGDYVAFIDDDDTVAKDYIEKILKAVESKSDCCSLEGQLVRRKERISFYHSIQHNKWFKKDGKYYRCPNHLNVVKRELALQTGFKHLTVGEDKDYSVRLLHLLKTEVKITGILYHYISL